MLASPIEIQRYLGGIEYPVDKGSLIETARKAGAPNDVLNELEMLPDKEYDGPHEVTHEISEGAPAK